MPPRGGWSELQIAYMRWLCLPSDKDMGGKGKGLRDPATPTEFARKFGVDLKDLYEWQRIQGWEKAFNVVAEQTFVSLKPLFLKNLTVSILKPDPNDRLYTAKVRYIDPIIERHEEDGMWQRDLPQSGGNPDKLDISQAKLSGKLRALPHEQREIVLDILGDMLNSDLEEPNLAPFYSVMKPYADDDAAPDQVTATPADRLLPAPAPVVEADTADTTPTRYNPTLRKPLRRPRT